MPTDPHSHHVTDHHTDSAAASAFEARISAWVDGEDDIRPEDLATPYGRQLWGHYHLIGDVLRSGSLAMHPSPLFYARLSKAIDAEPPIVAPTRWWAQRTLLSGLALVAAIALVTWVALPALWAPSPPSSVLANGDTRVLRDYMEAHADITGSGALARVAFTGTRP